MNGKYWVNQRYASSLPGLTASHGRPSIKDGGRGIRYVIIGTRLLATIHGAGRPTLWKLGVAGLSGMGIFNFVVIVDTARKLWKFCIRTQMPIQNVRVAKGS